MKPESHVSVITVLVLKYIQKKRVSVDKQEQRIIEDHIQRNIKPARKGWFKDKPEATYDDILNKLDDYMIDDMFGKLTWRNYLTRRTSSQVERLDVLESMCEDSASGEILLCKSDYQFITEWV